MAPAQHPEICTPATALARLRRAAPPAVRTVLRRLVAAGGRPVLVGGAVRDVFCNLAPKDWDIAVDLPVAAVAGAFERVARHGEKHGTVMLIVRGLPVEVSVFRGARPGDVYADALHADLMHRDFTVNAMAADVLEGVLHDPFGGRDDLCRARLRGVADPEARVREDPLRALRAARFVATHPWRLEVRTRAALATARLDQVAAERRRDELLGILGATDPARGLRVLDRAGVLKQFVPALAPLVRTGWPQLRRGLPGRPFERWVFWAWHHRCSVEAFEALLVGLRVSRAHAAQAARTLAALMRLPATRAPRNAALRRWIAGAASAPASVAPVAAALAELRRPGAYRAFASAVTHEIDHACLTVSGLAVDGHGLLQHGIPAKHIGKLLQQLLLWVCDAPSRNARALLLAQADVYAASARS